MNEVKFAVVGIILLYVQVLYVHNLAIFSTTPNILLAYCFIMNLKIRLDIALIISFFIGLMYDLTQPHMLGFHLILFVTLSYSINTVHVHLHKENGWVFLLGVLATVLFYHLLWLIWYLISLQSGMLLPNFILSFLYAFLINLAVSYFLLFFSRIKVTIND